MSHLRTVILLLTSALIASSSDSERRDPKFVTAKLEGRGEEQRSQRTAYLYKAPSPYQSPGRPVLNSFIVTSRPLDLTKGTQRRVGGLYEEITPESHDGYRYLPQYKIECDSKRGSCSETITVPPTPTTPPTFRPYTTEMIDRFMQDLDQEKRRNEEKSQGDSRSEDEENQETSKGTKSTTWYRPFPHRPPEHDKKGWVSLDPVPWSSSKISKWTSDKHNPVSRPPEATRRPWISQPSYHSPSSSHDQGSYTWHGPNKPHRPQELYQYLSSEKPSIITDGKDPEWPSTHTHHRPSYSPEHWPSRHPEYHRPEHRPDYHEKNDRPQSWESNQQNEWPIHRRPQKYPTPVVYQDTPSSKPHSFEGGGGGQWVVFSDTKEYKPISDRRSFGRSLETRAKSLAKGASGRRTVRLTVLPSMGNTTTSHGGMLEVDASSDTVDEDRRKRRQLMLANRTDGESETETPTSVVIRGPVTVAGRGTGLDRARTVMAAVGAGMVPATMAVILPMMLAQRKRRSIQLSQTPEETREQKVYNRRLNVKAF